jgi:Uma2 family endonuclease
LLSEPQPDLAVFKPRADFYAKKHPTIKDVLFIVEVSDTTLSYDQKIKLPRYAAAAIPEVWIEDLKAEVLHVYRKPTGETYKSAQKLYPGDSVSPLCLSDATFGVDELLNTDFATRE